MRVARPFYQLFIHGYPNSSSDAGHLGWLFSLGVPWPRRWGASGVWVVRLTLLGINIHSEGLTLSFPPLHRSLALLHRYGYCAEKRKPLLSFGAYGLYGYSTRLPK